jgi:prepilin-type N-terminal cleavage/methylation domain-containing protein
MRAFSLIELSIVLVILGLLTGGILAGQSLIRASELRSVTSELSRYRAATMAFKDKYFGLPGDLTNATAIWGIASGTLGNDTTCYYANTAGKTCNGDGDGMIGLVTVWEYWRYWQQLALSGLIEGGYNGVQGPGGSFHAVAGQNVPAAKLSGMGWQAKSIATPYAGGAGLFAGNYGNVLYVGETRTNGALGVNAMNAEEAWNIDTKIDDGKPGTGRALVFNTTGCTDTINYTLADAATASYNFTVTTNSCTLVFTNVF